MDGLALRSAGGYWVLAAAVLGSGLAFLDGTVVNVALPDTQRELRGVVAHQPRELEDVGPGRQARRASGRLAPPEGGAESRRMKDGDLSGSREL